MASVSEVLDLASRAFDDIAAWAGILASGGRGTIPGAHGMSIEDVAAFLVEDVRAVDGALQRLEEGSASSYLTVADRSAIRALRVRGASIASRIPARRGVSDAGRGRAEEHILAATGEVSEAVGEVEEAVVTAESRSVDVLEPDEKEGGAATLVIAAIAVAAFVWWATS